MPSPTLTFESITGVDVQLQIAGPGSRSFAFLIDWHIRLVLALAWLIVAAWVITGSPTMRGAFDGPDGATALIVLPAIAIYLLYHPVLEVSMRGRTPGKRMAKVRLVTRQGDLPGIGALVIRNLFRLIDSLPMAYVVGLITVMFTEHHVRIGDLAAGTLLVMDRTSDDTSFPELQGTAASGAIDARSAELARELLDRWADLDADSRWQLARALLMRIDPSFAQASDSMSASAMRERLRSLLGI